MRTLSVVGLILLLSISALAMPRIAVINDRDWVASDWLSEAGIPYLRLSDSDVEFGMLRGFDIAIWAQPVEMRPDAAVQLREFMDRGGRVVGTGPSFFSNPDGSLLTRYGLSSRLGLRRLIQDEAQADWVYQAPQEWLLTGVRGGTPLLGNTRRGLHIQAGSIPLARWSLEMPTGFDLATGISLSPAGMYFAEEIFQEAYLEDQALKQVFLNGIFYLTHNLDEIWASIESAQAGLTQARPGSAAAEASTQIEQAKAAFIQAQATFPDSQAYGFAQKAKSLAQQAHLSLIPSREQETRAVWVRPPRNAGEIRTLMESLKAANFNVVFVETFWEGQTIYPGRLTRQRPEFAHFDPLQTFIDLGQELGIQVHAWLEVFFVGYKNPGPVLTANPDWAALNINGSPVVGVEDDKYFISPAHPEARAWLMAVFMDLLEHYAIDGLHLDYIRYPVNRPLGFDYSKASVEAFKQKTGYDAPRGNEPQAVWDAWAAFKVENVTSFVREFYHTAKGIDEAVQITAAVFESRDALQSKSQDWVAWLDEGILDWITLMLYTRDPAILKGWLERSDREIGEKVSFVPGLGPIIIPEADLMLAQTMAVLEMELPGVAFFAAQHLTPEFLEVLKQGPFRTPAQPGN